VLHAQGGGQPTDLGSITLNNETKQQQVVNITKVLLDRTTGVATHTGTMATTTTTTSSSSGDNSTTTMMMMMDDIVGNAVQVTVNSPNRQILSECHTAGHVVDSAMAKCDSLMPPTKGYHFLDGPYVEYKGSVPVDDRPALLEKLQTAFQELVEDDIDTQIQVLSNKAAAEEVCQNRGVPENYFNLNDFGDETVRIVTVAGWPCPCGGTHVKSTGALKEREWGITGLRCKKGVFRVKYGQQWNSTTK
jgi:Ser-tRNA(Ala) deacylase AlaX